VGIVVSAAQVEKGAVEAVVEEALEEEAVQNEGVQADDDNAMLVFADAVTEMLLAKKGRRKKKMQSKDYFWGGMDVG